MVDRTLLLALLKPDWLARRAFPAEALKAIDAAVSEAEQGHRGEIRVVIALSPDVADLLRSRSLRERAVDAFARLRVWDTEGNSGVLIYLGWAEHQVEIVADRGIAERVPAQTWEEVCSAIAAGCRAGQPTAAIVAAIQEVGTLLRAHFPLAAGGINPNELPNPPRLE